MILRQTVAELFDPMVGGTAVVTFMEEPITVCSTPKGANDVISSTHVRHIVLDNVVKFVYPRVHCCRDIGFQVVGNGILVLLT